VQVDDIKSREETVLFGVPHGSVLGPILFNLYTVDLQDEIGSPACQYADDTTIYSHCEPSSITESLHNLLARLDLLRKWSRSNNLAFNEKKTKIMLFSTTQLSRVHHLDDKQHPSFNVEYKGSKIERTTCYKLLGVQFDQHLDWKQHVDKIAKAVNSKLNALKHLKRTANFQLRKQLAETNTLSLGMILMIFLTILSLVILIKRILIKVQRNK